MAIKTWTLTDSQHDLQVDQFTLDAVCLDGVARRFSVTKQSLQAGLSRGVDIVEINNGRFRFTVVPTRGMGIWKAALGELQLAWKSPVRGPVHPSFVCLWEPSGLGWLDGFDEMFVRCGLENNGAPVFHDNGSLRYPLHGRIANIPAQKVELTVDDVAGEIAISGVVEEARLFGNKLRLETTISTSVNRPGLTVTDTVVNISAEMSQLQLLYHVNFGVPLLGPGARAVLPVVKVAPRDKPAMGNLAEWNVCGPETPGAPEVVFYTQLCSDADGRTHAMLRNAAGTKGVSLLFNTRQLPCFSLWKNRQATADGYVVGLEPGTNYPNRKPFEQQHGRVVELEPGESRTFELLLEAHGDAAAVAAAEQAVAKLQQGVKPEVIEEPNPEWST
jgi:galactose mutarotase-like enzyme